MAGVSNERSFCANPVQCVAYHELNAQVSEMKAQLSGVHDLLKLFFQSWKTTLTPEAQTKQKVQELFGNNECQTSASKKRKKSPKGEGFGMSILKTEPLNLSSVDVLTQLSEGLMGRGPDTVHSASVTQSMSDDFNFSQTSSNPVADVLESQFALSMPGPSTSGVEGGIETSHSYPSTPKFSDSFQSPLSQTNDGKPRVDTGPCWKTTCSGRTFIEYPTPNQVVKGRTARFRCRVCRASKSLLSASSDPAVRSNLEMAIAQVTDKTLSLAKI